MPIRSRTSAAIAALTLATLLAGCAGGTLHTTVEPEASAPLVPLAELDVLDDPKSWQGESRAVLFDTAIKPVTDAPEQSLPVTVTSHDLDGDREVTVTDTTKILGLDMAGSISATIAGLGFGDNLVGRDASSTFPQVADLPLVTTGGHSINAESVIALRPNLIITDGTIGPIDVLLQLRDVGITIVFVDPGSGFQGAYDLAEQVARALGADAAGQMLVDQLRGDIAAKTAEIAAITPQEADKKLRMLFLYLRGDSGIYYLFGSESGVDDLISAVGGIDVASEIGWEGMKPMTDEAIIAAAPDLILVMSSGLESTGGVDGLLKSKVAIGITPAGQNRRFVSMADGEILSFGPRTPDVIDAVARAIYAPQP
jgi:iron complex transport system substrate-binding protein